MESNKDHEHSTPAPPNLAFMELTLRDVFAIAALQGLLGCEYWSPANGSQKAFEYADAMLAERNKS